MHCSMTRFHVPQACTVSTGRLNDTALVACTILLLLLYDHFLSKLLRLLLQFITKRAIKATSVQTSAPHYLHIAPEVLCAAGSRASILIAFTPLLVMQEVTTRLNKKAITNHSAVFDGCMACVKSPPVSLYTLMTAVCLRDSTFQLNKLMKTKDILAEQEQSSFFFFLLCNIGSPF